MTQPEALRLADELDHGVGTIDCVRHEAAAELRRLHEVETLYCAAMRGRHALSDEVLNLTAQRDALLEALKMARPHIATHSMDGYHAEARADAAIKKAEEGK